MIELIKSEKEKAILVGIKTRDKSRKLVEEHLQELEMLAETAGAETILKVIQERITFDSAFCIGKGKAEEVAELAELNDVNLIIFDEDLTPTQVRNLEKIINRKIVDRSGLILDIFAAHAKTRQAKTQVELAQLQYMLPRLTRAWTHLSKQYGGIGTKGPGETQIETDRRIIRTRISHLKESLEKIDAQDTIKSAKRKNFLNVSIVGYTNAGKSTLMNLLTKSELLAENKLFATLDSTTRSFELEKNKTIIISDTVGFIRKLPPHLIASFKSTLNVVREADYILHVVDISNDFYEEHISVVQETLKELKCDNKPTKIVFNKVDELKDNSRLSYSLNKYNDSIAISALKGMNISTIYNTLLKVYEENFREETVELQIHETKKISLIHQLADVISTKYIHDKVQIHFRTDIFTLNKIKRLIYDK
jgi:GTP-binding protein HflX